MSEPRYAVYLAPDGASPLGIAGARWLGRDAIGGSPLNQPECPGLTAERLAELTQAPRRYGLHGTLKPPMRLRPGRSVEALFSAVAELATRQQPFQFQVRLQKLGGFFAWTPYEPCPRLHALGAACVTELDTFRAPPSEDDLVRRRPGLNRHQLELLYQWGYPWVLDEFRFHMTLTDDVQGAEAATLYEALARYTAVQAQDPVLVDSLCVFVEPQPGAEFRLLRRFGFGGSFAEHG